MIEAAVAYAECTGKSRLLEKLPVARLHSRVRHTRVKVHRPDSMSNRLVLLPDMADHIYRHFIEEGAEGYPGHPEIELALMRLYRSTTRMSPHKPYRLADGRPL